MDTIVEEDDVAGDINKINELINMQADSKRNKVKVDNSAERQLLVKVDGFTIDPSNDKIHRGDPLGLGIVARPAPSDYGKYEYNPEYERANGTLSLLSEKEYKETIDDGFMSIQNVRKLVANSMCKLSHCPDSELIILIDARINYPIFIVEDNVYTREELFEIYAFQELEQIPEHYFARQIIGVFKNDKKDLPDLLIAKDEDDESLDFVKFSDLYKLESRKKEHENFVPQKPNRTVTTKIYVAKSRWDDFLSIEKTFRVMIRMKKMAEKNNPGGSHGILNMLQSASSSSIEWK